MDTLELPGPDGWRGPRVGPGVSYGFLSTPVTNANVDFVFSASLVDAATPGESEGGFWRLNRIGFRSFIFQQDTDGRLGPNLGPGIEFDGFMLPQLDGVGNAIYSADLNILQAPFASTEGI